MGQIGLTNETFHITKDEIEGMDICAGARGVRGVRGIVREIGVGVGGGVR